LRIRLAKVGCPTQRGLALLKCCEATILTAVLRVKRTPRIVLRLGWIVEHSRRSNDTEHKQDKFHQHAPIGVCSRLNNKKSWRGSSLISVKIKIAAWPPAASRRLGQSNKKTLDHDGQALAHEIRRGTLSRAVWWPAGRNRWTSVAAFGATRRRAPTAVLVGDRPMTMADRMTHGRRRRREAKTKNKCGRKHNGGLAEHFRIS